MNSYNMDKLGEDLYMVNHNVDNSTQHDLAVCTQGNVEVALHIPTDNPTVLPPVDGDFIALETAVDPTKISFDHYNEDPAILKVVDSNGITEYKSHSLRSNCRVTNQPDWGDIYIAIEGDQTVTPESLLQYIVSMRKENHFHEEICECVYKRLFDLLDPKELFVACLYTRRGGIDINPVRASSQETLEKYASNMMNVGVLNDKTQRQ
jgi:7-cyano-7-deazaguanine reductase